MVDFTVDLTSVVIVLKAAEGLNFVFHKAIDLTPNPIVAMQALARIKGITHILTSGGAPTAKKGAAVIRDMHNQSQHIKIIAAGNIKDYNLNEHIKLLGVYEYHGKQILGHLNKKNSQI